MPAGYMKERPYPGKYVKLSDAASGRQMIVVHCKGCRRTVRFLAEDLMQLLDPERDVMTPPFPCSKCQSSKYLTVTVISPNDADVGVMELRRPGPVRRRQTWLRMKLGDPLPAERRPVRRYPPFELKAATERVIDGTKGPLLEQIAQLRAEGQAIATGARVVLERDADMWRDASADRLSVNQVSIDRLEAVVTSIEEIVEQIREG